MLAFGSPREFYIHDQTAEILVDIHRYFKAAVPCDSMVFQMDTSASASGHNDPTVYARLLGRRMVPKTQCSSATRSFVAIVGFPNCLVAEAALLGVAAAAAVVVAA